MIGGSNQTFKPPRSTLLVLGALPWVVREELPFKARDQRVLSSWEQV